VKGTQFVAKVNYTLPGRKINNGIRVVWIWAWKSPLTPLSKRGEMPPFGIGRRGGICDEVVQKKVCNSFSLSL